MRIRRRSAPTSRAARARALPAEAAGAPHVAAADGRDPALRLKYAELCRRHVALVERHASLVRSRTDVTALALAALRHGPAAVALVAPGAIRARDPKWLRLTSAQGGPLVELGGDGAATDREHATLDAAADALVRRVRGDRTDALRVQSALTAHILELRIARLQGERSGDAIVFAEDVTGRVRADRELGELRQALAAQERLRVLGLLAAGVTHDLGNVLQAMQLRLDLARREVVAPAAAGQLDALAALADDMRARLHRLQELTTGGAAAGPARVDLGDAVVDAVEMARPLVDHGAPRRQGAIAIQLEVPALLPRVAADPAELRHAVLGLVLNARDAMPDGGLVRVRAMHAGAWGMITVSDEGPGFAPEYLRRAFEPFVTTRGAGHPGLGLSATAALAARAGGAVALENRVGGGARVRLTLPAWRAPVEPGDGADGHCAK